MVASWMPWWMRSAIWWCGGGKRLRSGEWIPGESCGLWLVQRGTRGWIGWGLGDDGVWGGGKVGGLGVEGVEGVYK